MQFKALLHLPEKSGGRLTKTLLIMKMTIILLTITFLHASAGTLAQTVTISVHESSLEKVFTEVEKQTGYVFFYDGDLLKGRKPVSITAKDLSIADFLRELLKEQQLDYNIEKQTILIKKKEPLKIPFAGPSLATDPPMANIHGRVTDSLGAPLAGASVTIKGTHKGTKTNAKGEFDMENVRSGTVLVISYTGYSNKEVTLTNDGQIYIVLQRSQDILDATIIQAYGTTSRRFSVGSISTVDASTIEKQPVSNVLQALQGQVPGLAINASSGVPGSRVLVQIRGQNTILNDPSSFFKLKPYDQPLFIVDGVPFAPQNVNISQLANMATASFNAGGIDQPGGLSPFNGINPMDIESVSVLKDADATSIYGTQGSNGVILITTKKGKAGKTDFNLTANTGFNFAAHMVKLLNTQQYLQMRKDAFAADGVTPSTNPNTTAYAPDLTIFDQNKYTNWQKVIYGKTSHNTDIHASISGGTANSTFLISGGYTRNDFNFPGSGYADQRLTLHSNLHLASTDNRLTMDLGMDFGYDQNNSPGFGGGSKVLLPPNMPDLLDKDGNLVWGYKGVNLSQNYQFYAYLKQPVKLQNYNLNDVLRLSYKLLPGLSLSANLGYSRNTSSERSQKPASAQPPSNPVSSASFATNNFETVNIEPQLDYITTIGKGVLSALAGATYKKNVNNSNNTQGSGYSNDNFLGSINGAATVYSSDQFNLYRYAAGFARLKYVYDQKYILSLTGRRDGSSNFGPGRRFGDFGSVGAGWIFSEEKVFKAALPFISYAKLSGSYGTSGSDGVAPYLFQAFWQPVSYIPSFQGVQPNAPVNLYNPDYSWALKKSLNLSLDLGFFHDRMLVNATWYRNREGNQLGGYPLPAQDGFPSVLQNMPATIQNKGWEFSVNAAIIKTKAFSWSMNFNLSFNRNKLLSFPNLESSPYAYTYVVGQSVSQVLGFIYKGVNPTTGLFQYATRSGHDSSAPTYGTAARGGDQVLIANREVKYMGGFGNTFSYKGFSLYFFVQFSSQMAPNYLTTVYSGYPGLQMNNLPAAALDYWKKPGDHATLEKLTVNFGSPSMSAQGYFSNSTGAYSDDTYFRLKTTALSYSLPDKWMKRAHIHSCNIFVNAQNLLTVTDYKVTDPEQFNDYTAVPLQRTVVFGLNFNF